MKGLLIKDLKLMKVQKNFFFMIFAVGIGMAVFTDNISFIIGYISVVSAMFTLSSISYDEFDNGSAFLFSLPISRKDYVMEKYMFGLIISGASLSLSTLVAVGAAMIRRINLVSETLVTASGVLAVLLGMLAVMIPVVLKYGGEKGRVAIIGFIGVIFVIGLLAVKGAKLLKLDFTELAGKLASLQFKTVFGILIAAAAAALLISYRISLKIMEKREF